ncbi:MAG TPA: histidine kinase [Streptosporangiaceae bacterium]|nr:histidine kinase [Streptosporangiaceae bacterium]
MDGIAGVLSREGRRARPAAGWLWQGLAGAAWGGDPAPAWRSPWWRRVTYGALAAATGLLAMVSLAFVPRLNGPAGLFRYQVLTFKAVPVKGVFAGQGIHRKIAGAHRIAVAQAAFRPAGLIALNGSPIGAATLDVLVALAVVVPVALTVRYPLLGWRLGWAGLWFVPWAHVNWSWGWVWGPVLLAGVATTFAVAGVRQSRPVLCWMWAATVVPWLWHQGLHATGIAGCLGLAALAVAADAMAARRRAQLLAAGQAERAELEQARRAVLEERARIARELHDVVAHHLSLIAVRAESAPYRLTGLDDPVGAEFGSLSAAAREALADMRRLLGVLRSDEPASRAPQPQLTDVPDLVASARRAGVAVALTGPASWGAVPAGVGVCAYRIVQESLSNASRHAPGAPVTVTVGHDPHAVSLHVSNGPGQLDVARTAEPAEPAARAARVAPAEAAKAPEPAGHGLAGMRERVALLGGTFAAGPAPGGGFMVSAILPFTQAA